MLLWTFEGLDAGAQDAAIALDLFRLGKRHQFFLFVKFFWGYPRLQEGVAHLYKRDGLPPGLQSWGV